MFHNTLEIYRISWVSDQNSYFKGNHSSEDIPIPHIESLNLLKNSVISTNSVNTPIKDVKFYIGFQK